MSQDRFLRVLGMRGGQPAFLLVIPALIGFLMVAFPVLAGVLFVLALGAGAILLVARLLFHDDAPLLRWVLAWTSVALVARTIAGTLIGSSPQLIGFLGPDARAYDNQARDVMLSWTAHMSHAPLTPGKEGFPLLLASIYWAVGPNVLAGIGLNAVLGAALVPVTADLTRRLGGPQAARYAAPLVALLPDFVVWSSQLLREAAVYLALAVALNAAVRLYHRSNILPFLVLAGGLGGLLFLREFMSLALLLGLTAGFLLAIRHSAQSRGRGLLIAGTVALATVGVWKLSASYGTDPAVQLSRLSDYRVDVSRQAGSAFNPEVNRPGHIPLEFLPTATAKLMLGPFPWEVHNSGQALGLVSAVANWLLVLWFFRGLKGARRPRLAAYWLPLTTAIVLTFIFALASGNYGFAIRERAQVMLLLVPFVSLGIARRAAVPPKRWSLALPSGSIPRLGSARS